MDVPLLRIQFPLGYPEFAAARISLQAPPSCRGSPHPGAVVWTRRQCDDMTQRLQAHANKLVGQEAILDVVQYMQQQSVEQVMELMKMQQQQTPTTNNEDEDLTDNPKATQELWSRQWIWVHHITDTGRRKSIIQHARDHFNLCGYLKYGYPGVIVVEGRHVDCHAFVAWVKGNKSRPGGGFGRNWGHHVRGEINFTTTANDDNDDDDTNNDDNATRAFTSEFVEVEDMRDLSAACKEAGCEDEFLTYVMQH